MSQMFKISDVNPNDTVGGGGCVCSETKNRDCKPPYAIFYATDMEAAPSPNVVVCEKCLIGAAVACADTDEVLGAGEVSPVEVDGPGGVEALERGVEEREDDTPDV